jgi:hypothetical protein
LQALSTDAHEDAEEHCERDQREGIDREIRIQRSSVLCRAGY